MRKVPKLSKAKGKRWLKGQSSSSNPETKKFREAAKSRFFRHETGTSSALTIGALKTLDAFTSTKSLKKPEPIEIDEESNASSWVSAKTFKTFASDWSECSNASFSKLLKNFQPNSFMHKEMLAVLAAITEVIKANGGKETSTEYFGALMTALSISESEDSTAAILTLLSMGIKTVPHEVLQLKFSEASKTFIDILAKYSELENPAILRATIGCLSVLLRAQDPGVWSNASTTEIFHSVLVFSTYAKPKIRKAAQHAVCAILKASYKFSEEDTHPAASTAAKYCIQQIEKGVMGGGTTTLHILTLLKEIISTFPKSHIKTSCETILKLMTLGNPLITTCSFEVLHGLFVSSPPTTRLLPTLNAQIIHALYDYQPSNTDTQATLAWLTVMQEAHRTLAKNDPNLCAENLTKFFITASKLWLSDKDQIVKGSFVTLRTVAMDCIQLCSEARNHSQMCQNIFVIVENGLKYQYNTCWVHVFSLLGVLFEVIGPNGESYMGNCLKSLANLRDSNNFGFTSELEILIGKAIRSLGPEIVLKVIPFSITGKEVNYEFKTSWMLPVLKANIQTSTIKFFMDYFLPMALICERKAKELNAANDRIGAHSYDLLQHQIWALLPSFCNNANDIKTNFKGIAKTLGVIINDRKQLRVPVMAALRKLVAHCQSSRINEDQEELSKFAKNYLPILFNLYTTKPKGTDEEGERLAAFETVKVYLTITNPDLIGELFDKALTHLEEKKDDLYYKESVLDLIKILIPYQNEERLEKIYAKCMATLKDTKDKKDEKKSYRLLEELCASESETCKKFVAEKRKEILAFLLKSLKKTKVTNRGARLRCLFRMVKLLPKNQIDAIKSIIPETIICCKDINQNTRAYAFRMLEEIFIICREWSTKSNEDTIRDYIGLIFGGLAGSQTLVSASVLALAKLTHVLRAELPDDLMGLILENICTLSALPTREIVGPCVGYLKLFITAFQKDRVLPYVPTIVKALVSMTEDCKRHCRLKVRDVLDRLLRKYGYDTIQPLVPKDDNIMQKRLKNLKRINAKKKTGKEDVENDEEDGLEEFALKAKPKSIEEILASSDESDGEPPEPKKKSRKQKKQEMFIQEDSDDIIDFASPSATGKVSASKPAIKTSKKKESDVKMSSDGRLIITDDADDDMGSDDGDSDLDDVASAMSEVVIGKKRKLSSASDIPNKYQAGGSGIHRPLDQDEVPVRIPKKEKDKRKNNKDVSGFKSGKEYRAKKAKGDVKLKGKPDPYAYIPLSRKLLNRRKKLKNSGKFKNIIRAAVKGAKKGSKAKMRGKK